MRRPDEYYNRFSASYDSSRNNAYHAFVDGMEVDVVAPHARGKTVLEAGCGTGLILDRLKNASTRLIGSDISRSMLESASRRGLRVIQADICRLPFKSGSFDVVYSFKVLPHVKDVGGALKEMARVTKRDGHLFCEFYNRFSLRFLARAVKGARYISAGTTDRDVYTRYDGWKDIVSQIPPSCRLEGSYGVRIWTPIPSLFAVPVLGRILAFMERISSRGPMKRFAGFVILKLRRLA